MQISKSPIISGYVEIVFEIIVYIGYKRLSDNKTLR